MEEETLVLGYSVCEGGGDTCPDGVFVGGGDIDLDVVCVGGGDTGPGVWCVCESGGDIGPGVWCVWGRRRHWSRIMVCVRVG